MSKDTSSNDLAGAERAARDDADLCDPLDGPGPDDLAPELCNEPGCEMGDIQQADGTYGMCPVCEGWGVLL